MAYSAYSLLAPSRYRLGVVVLFVVVSLGVCYGVGVVAVALVGGCWRLLWMWLLLPLWVLTLVLVLIVLGIMRVVLVVALAPLDKVVPIVVVCLIKIGLVRGHSPNLDLALRLVDKVVAFHSMPSM